MEMVVKRMKKQKRMVNVLKLKNTETIANVAKPFRKTPDSTANAIRNEPAYNQRMTEILPAVF